MHPRLIALQLVSVPEVEDNLNKVEKQRTAI